MGRIVGPWGIKGWVKIQPYTETVAALGDHDRWWVGRDADLQEMALRDSAVHGAMLVAQLADIDDREAALRLKGCEVAVPRTALPATGAGEYYWADLVGLAVVNVQGEMLGRVAGHFSNGAHDVMRVEHDGPERLIPFVDAVIRAVDMARGRIVVDWGADW